MTEEVRAYKTAGALKMAVKAAAKASPMDTGRAVESSWFHRLLCRVFQEPDSGFVLKGDADSLLWSHARLAWEQKR